MPAKSSSSSVRIWPDASTVVHALHFWAQKAAIARPEVVRVGYVGSYSRGDWGVGSDLDVVILVSATDTPWERRAAEWDFTEFPVPVDVLVYTLEEWERLGREGRLARLREEAIWVYSREGADVHHTGGA